MSSDDEDILEATRPIEDNSESTNLWVIAYSDFMTILMIFFLMMFAHRVWSKNIMWEEERQAQLRAAEESQKGIVQRLRRLANIEMQTDRININLPDALLFDAGQSKLRDSAHQLISGICPELLNFKGQIVVEGHTDNLPVGSKSPFKSNWELSIARAFSVIQELTANGVDPGIISARGYGEFRPKADNDTPEHRSQNRRIEIILLHPRTEGGGS